MILGKPGAGKSTFATYVANTYCNETLQADWIPVLLRLSEIDTRTPFKLLERLGGIFGKTQEITQQILESSKVFLILDGLDEVSSQLRQDICQEISNFVNKCYLSKVVITCRSDVKDYKLPSVFEFVEIADLDKKQQQQFIENWFSIADTDPTNWMALQLKQHPECTNQSLINHLLLNERIRELAKTPILLNLICLVYVSDGDLPKKRSTLYERGLDILLEQWDENRSVNKRIESFAYKSLRSDEKRKILGNLARNRFEQAEDVVVFEQTAVLKIIADCQNCTPQESLEILEGIAADHGLLFQSARKRWEFSHLTFQEYFVAQWFVQHQDWQRLAQNVFNPRWREVFLLTLEMVTGEAAADSALKLMKIEVDNFLNQRSVAQRVLKWVEEKTLLSKLPYRASAIRAFKLAHILYPQIIAPSYGVYPGYGLVFYQNSELPFSLDEKLLYDYIFLL